MTAVKETIFISYRRSTSQYPALLVYKALSPKYDVFIDYENIDSGKFAQVILNQIAARGHFIVILSPGCLDRTVEPGDWLRKEIEYAIEMERNIIPLLFDGFSFNTEKRFFTGKLTALPEYNALNVPTGYFDEAMTKLQNRFLKQPVKGVIKSPTQADQDFAQEVMQNAEKSVDAQIKQGALNKYLRVAPTEKQQTPDNTDIPPKKKPAWLPETDINQWLQSLRGPATKEILGREPLKNEKVIISGSAKRMGIAEFNIRFNIRDEKGLLILTDRRLVFKANIPSYSFEISRIQLLQVINTSQHKDNGYQVTFNPLGGLPNTLWLPKDNLYETLKKELKIKEE